MVDYRDGAAPIVKEFLRYEKKNHDLSDKTISEYYLDLRVFFRFMKIDRGIVDPDIPFEEIPVDDITLEFVKGITKLDINNYIDYLRSDRVIHTNSMSKDRLGLSPAATKRKYACLRSFYNYLCVGADLIDVDPTAGVLTPQSKRNLPSYLSESEAFRLLDSVDGSMVERNYCILLFFLSCGLRVSEIVGLDKSDVRYISEKEAYLNIRGKGGKERQVFLSENCIEALMNYLLVRDEENAMPEAKNAIFLSQKHYRVSVSAVQRMVKKFMLKSGLPAYSPHKLRHTSATLMLANGVDVRVLQELLGHSSLSTTQIYTHVQNDQIRTAARANPISKYTSAHATEKFDNEKEKETHGK